MSAYMVDREHVRYLVVAGLNLPGPGHQLRWWWHDSSHHLPPGDHDRATAVGQMLWNENRKSIEYRYPDTVEDFSDAPGPIGEDFAFRFEPWVGWGRVDPVQVLKSLSCYEYQACEHPGWRTSEAYAFCEALRDAAIGALRGYEDAEWGAPSSFCSPAGVLN